MTERGYSRRRDRTRRSFNTVLVVCEGLKTERIYLKGLNERYGRVHILPVHSGSTDVRSMVRFAVGKRREYQFREGDGNETWCVFDVDEKDDDELLQWIPYAERNGVMVALSNPSFELWYLLHFDYRPGPTDRYKVLEDLKRSIPDYEKSGCYNHILYPLTMNAIDNSKRLNKEHSRIGVDLNSKKANPSTQVFKLIEAVKLLKERNG
ncbi:MAG: RloB family protein [Candidatus Thermoplasmatota archaeon]|nr:RloB family protein [Candidatus Thermoplasmatota archaeon]